MALQDLTPQLRTRLTKMERAVGWFVFLATVLLLFGFGYYLYHAAERKGWFLVSAKFYTYVNSAAGLNNGDPVQLMGFQVGRITDITAMPPRTGHNVKIDFVVNQINQGGTPYYSYIWSEGSVVKLNSDFLGKRGLEISRGTGGFGIYATLKPQILTIEEAKAKTDPQYWRMAQDLFDENSNVVVRAWTSFTNMALITKWATTNIVAFDISARQRHILAVWNNAEQRYEDFDETNIYELPVAETPAVSDQLQAMVLQIKQALPNVLMLTNKLYEVLDNAAKATSNLNVTVAATQPLVKNFADISGDLHGPGALGTWVLGTNSTSKLEDALANANTLLVNVNTNLDTLTDQVSLTLINLANITSNLNAQVQANSNMLWGISKTVTDSDDFIQGLKRHWLLRSAFKKKSKDEPGVKPVLKNLPPTKGE